MLVLSVRCLPQVGTAIVQAVAVPVIHFDAITRDQTEDDAVHVDGCLPAVRPRDIPPGVEGVAILGGVPRPHLRQPPVILVIHQGLVALGQLNRAHGVLLSGWLGNACVAVVPGSRRGFRLHLVSSRDLPFGSRLAGRHAGHCRLLWL